MTTLIIFALFGVGLFLAVLLFARKNTPQGTGESAALIAVGEMVSLGSFSLKGADQILDDADYRLLRSDRAFAGITKSFLDERRELALMWIGLLCDDLTKLYRFRGFLVRSGQPAPFHEEIQIAYQLCSAVLYLNFLKVLVRAFGPFALLSLTHRAKVCVEGMSRASATVLNRLPSTEWPEIARAWQSCQ